MPSKRADTIFLFLFSRITSFASIASSLEFTSHHQPIRKMMNTYTATAPPLLDVMIREEKKEDFRRVAPIAAKMIVFDKDGTL
jgi:hypothetical protein